MCYRCAAQYVLGIDDDDEIDWDAIRWPEMTDAMREVGVKVAALYALPECVTGGPLHIATDDYNLEDSNLDFCERELDKHWSVVESPPGVLPVIVELVTSIIALLRPLTLGERATALYRATY